MPRLFRRDYVDNGNDSHWLSNPEEPLTGYDRIIGDEDDRALAAHAARADEIEERLAGTDGLQGKGFTLRKLREGRARQPPVRGRAVARRARRLLRREPERVVGASGPVDVSGACPVLAAWDGRDDLDSNGRDPLPPLRLASCSATSRRLPTGVSSGYAQGSEAIFDVPFDPADPVNTPRGLNTDNPLVGRALGRRGHRPGGRRDPARRRPLRELQYETRGGKQIPIHGGPGDARRLQRDQRQPGTPRPATPTSPHGSSFIAAMTWAKHGCPVRQLSFVTYGESENQESPHAADYTKAFSKKKWNRVPFCAADIREQATDITRVGR